MFSTDSNGSRFEQKERDWLLRSLQPLRLTPFPCLAGGLLAKINTTQGVDKPTLFCFCTPTSYKQVCVREVQKQKDVDFIDISLLRVGFLRKERDSNPRYSCPYTAFRVRPDRPLRHLSNAFCGANVRIYFLIATNSVDILHFFCDYCNFVAIFTNISVIFAILNGLFFPFY